MNIKIKNAILDNEKKLINAFPEYTQSINQFMKKVEKTKHDKTLFELVIASFASSDKRKQEEIYNSRGYKSSKQILIANKELLDMDDCLTLNNIILDNLYSSLDICSLAGNYNNQVGMYFIDQSNVIIKCTIEDYDRTYDDRWIKRNIILQYYMQTEDERNVKTLIFKKKPNATIFNALMEGIYINVHLFLNNKKGDDYSYKGIFHPCGLVDSNRAFLLFKSGFEHEVPYDNFDGEFINNLINDNKHMCNGSVNILSVKKMPTSIEGIIYHKCKTGNRNYIQQKKIDLEVEIRGEDLVVQYEKNKLIKQGYPSLADEVMNVAMLDRNLGYDIRSFDVDASGKIREIHIIVNSNVNSNIREFELNQIELANVESKPNDYFLYHIFDIYTDKPKLYAATFKEELFDVKPSKYTLALR